jgi:hypothetical protein
MKNEAMMMHATIVRVPDTPIIRGFSVSIRKATEIAAAKTAMYSPLRLPENPAKSRRIALEYLLINTSIEANAKSNVAAV